MGSRISGKLSVQDLKEFLSRYRDKVVSLRKVMEDFPPFHEHACSFPVSSLYHDLVSSMRERSVVFLDGAVFYLSSATAVLYKEVDYEFPPGTRIKTLFNFPYKDRKKLTEILYRLPDIFDRSMYRNSESYRSRIKHLKKLQKIGYREYLVTPDRLSDAKRLHDEWVEYKLSRHDTYRVMFPKNRYLSMLVSCVNSKLFPYKALIGYIGNEPVSLSLFLFWKGMVYSLIGISRYWEYSHIGDGVFLYQMRKLLEEGYEYVNVGYVQDRGIEEYKKKFPYIEVVTYVYSA